MIQFCNFKRLEFFSNLLSILFKFVIRKWNVSILVNFVIWKYCEKIPFLVHSFWIYNLKNECSNSCSKTQTPPLNPFTWMHACKLDQIDQSFMYIYDMDYGILIAIGKSSKGFFLKKHLPTQIIHSSMELYFH